MKGRAKAEIYIPVKEGEAVVWRQQHLPHELASHLREAGASHVVLAGIGGSVQAACQMLIDENMHVTVVQVFTNSPHRCLSFD